MTCAKCGCTIGYDCFCLGCPGGCGALSPERCQCNEPTDVEDGDEGIYADDPDDLEPGEGGWLP